MITEKEYSEKILQNRIPKEFCDVIIYEILGCIKHLTQKQEINQETYLSTLKENGFTEENIGNYIYLLGLIPDSKLLEDKKEIRKRIKFNIEYTEALFLFDLSVYDRVKNISIEYGEVKRNLLQFLKLNKTEKSKKALLIKILKDHKELNFCHWPINKLKEYNLEVSLPNEHVSPKYDVLVGSNKCTNQFGILGESFTEKKIAIDLSGTNTISLFGVQGAGKSYTIGMVAEMVLKQFSYVNQVEAPLAGVIFHYSESMEYEPEFTSMIYPNDSERELSLLKKNYGAYPNSIDDLVILTPMDKVEERKREYPSVKVLPIEFNPKELNVQDWMFLLGAVGSQENYVKQLKAIAKQHRKNINLDVIEEGVKNSALFTDFERGLALQKIDFAREYVKQTAEMGKLLKPGRLIIVDLRDEFLDKDEALGIFVILLNIFSSIKEFEGIRFNKFIVFDEAHKYMENKNLTANIVVMIREMRHKGVNIMIASQDPPSLPNEIIELSSIIFLHKFNSPNWLNHIKKSITQLEILSPKDMNNLNPGEGYLWSTKATEKIVTYKPLKIKARPRVTKHGGGTLVVGAVA